MALLSIDEVRALVPTDLTNAQLQAVIEREEAIFVARYGAHYVDDDTEVEETIAAYGYDLFVSRPVTSITSVVSGSTTITAAAYTLYAGTGWLKLNSGMWPASVVVTYVPANDNSLRKSVLIELIRLALSRTALKGESVAGEYSYSAPDWDAARAAIYRSYYFGGA